MTDKNANTEIRKEFCPNCEAETPCTHEAELFVCDICGEDFAKYIVSRKASVPDVSTTQDVLTSIKTSNSIENNNPDYYKHDELKKENAELKADLKNKNTRIAELEAEIDQLTAHDAAERQDDKWIPISENPTKSDWYLIMYQGYRVPDADYYDVEAGWLSDIPIPDYWMPLPELPEEVK